MALLLAQGKAIQGSQPGIVIRDGRGISQFWEMEGTFPGHIRDGRSFAWGQGWKQTEEEDRAGENLDKVAHRKATERVSKGMQHKQHAV